MVEPPDPVRARRARMARLSAAGQRFGYGCFILAIVAFAVGAVTAFSPPLVAAVVSALVAGSLALAPAIVLGYAVKAAERDDRERAS